MREDLELRNKIASQIIENGGKIKYAMVRREVAEKECDFVNMQYKISPDWCFQNDIIKELRACNRQLERLLK